MDHGADQAQSNGTSERLCVGAQPDDHIIKECYELIRSDRPLSEVMEEVKRLSGAKTLSTARSEPESGEIANANDGGEQINDPTPARTGHADGPTALAPHHSNYAAALELEPLSGAGGPRKIRRLVGPSIGGAIVLGVAVAVANVPTHHPKTESVASTDAAKAVLAVSNNSAAALVLERGDAARLGPELTKVGTDLSVRPMSVEIPNASDTSKQQRVRRPESQPLAHARSQVAAIRPSVPQRKRQQEKLAAAPTTPDRTAAATRPMDYSAPDQYARAPTAIPGYFGPPPPRPMYSAIPARPWGPYWRLPYPPPRMTGFPYRIGYLPAAQSITPPMPMPNRPTQTTGAAPL